MNGSNGYLPSPTTKILSNNQQKSSSSYMNFSSKPSQIIKAPSSQQQKKISHNDNLSTFKKSNSKENKYEHLPDI